MTSVHEVIDLDDNADVGMARRRAVLLAQECGLDEVRVGEVALIATEAGSNVLRHAARGVMVLGKLRNGDRQGLAVTVCDRGPGMDVARSMLDGVSTAASAGVGLGAIARMASAWDAYSQRPGGTVLSASVWARRDAPPATAFELGAISVPYPGERRCGDGWAAAIADDVCTVLVCDGLGHGDAAAEATAVVLASFFERPNAPLDVIIELASAAARPTRGAAAAVARIDQRLGTVNFAGMGNVAGWIASEHDQHAMVAQHGTLGQVGRKARVSTYPLPDGALVIMHSDGLESRWKLETYPGLVRHGAAVVAGVLWRELGRARDDATVVVARSRGPVP